MQDKCSQSEINFINVKYLTKFSDVKFFHKSIGLLGLQFSFDKTYLLKTRVVTQFP